MSPIKGRTPNEKDALFMMSVLKNMGGKPKVDWDAVAEAMSLKSGGVASVRFGQIKRKLGWKTSDLTSGGATVTTGFTGFTENNKVTKKKASATGSARVKQARKASAYEGDSEDDAVCPGDAKAKGDHSDEIKQEHEGKDHSSIDMLAAMKEEMDAEDEAGFNADNEEGSA